MSNHEGERTLFVSGDHRDDQISVEDALGSQEGVGDIPYELRFPSEDDRLQAVVLARVDVRAAHHNVGVGVLYVVQLVAQVVEWWSNTMQTTPNTIPSGSSERSLTSALLTRSLTASERFAAIPLLAT